MSGTFTALALAAGQLPNGVTTLYSSGVGTTTYLKQWLLYNEGSSSVVIILYLVPAGGNPVPFRRVVLETLEAYNVLEHGESITLTTGDAIAVGPDTASVIDYSLTGVIET